MIDSLNAFQGLGALQPDYFTMNIGGIHFYDAIVIVEKSPRLFEPFELRIGEPAL